MAMAGAATVMVPPVLAAAAAFDLAALMARLGAIKSGEATFVEQRFVRTLDAPLSASGTLSFAAPDRFARRTLKPRPESLSVEGNVVTVMRGGRSRTFTLDAAPEMTGVVEAVRGTLTGNEALVRRYFKAELSGAPNQWRLILRPLEAKIGEQVRQIDIAGRDASVERIEMTLTDGDYSVMTVTPTAVDTSQAAAAAPAPAAASPATAASDASPASPARAR